MSGSTSSQDAARDDLARLGDCVRAARLSNGLTQRGLSALTGIPRLRIIAIERGEGTVAIKSYALVARTLGLPLRAGTVDLIDAAPLSASTPHE